MQNDPVLVPLFAVAIESTLGAGALTIGSISVPAVLSAATMVAGSLALAYYMQPDAPRPQQGTIPLRQPMPSRIAGFGEVRLAGYYMLYEIAGTAAGVAHSFDVLALCQGPAGGFKQIFLDDAAVVVNPSDGNCSIPSGGIQYVGCAVNARRGARLETAFSAPGFTITGGWNAQCRGDRVVQLMLFSTAVAAADFLKVYPHGLPQPSAAVFLPCWDFRDPVQDPDNPDTWMNYPTWSSTIVYPVGARVIHGGAAIPGVTAGGMLYICISAGQVNIVPGAPGFDWCWVAVWKNPVLQAVTYLINQDFGMGLPRDRLITPSLAQLTAAAAVCDEPILLDAGGWESRYKSNPWFKLDTEPTEVLGLIMGACDGWLSLDGNGALSVRVGKFEPPTAILDESDIISVDLSYGVTDESKVDELQLSFTSPAHGYTTQAADPWRDDEAILNRGKVRSNAFGPASVQSATQIRRLAKRIFLRTNAMHGTVVTHLSGMKCAGQRYIQVRYPLIPELDNIAIELRRRETDIANRQCRFDFVVLDTDLLEGWIPSEEEGEPPPPPIVVPPVPLPVPQNVAAAAITGPPYLVAVSWDDVHWPGQFMVRWRVAASPGGPFTQMQFAAPADLGARLQVTVPGLTSGVAYEFQVASVAAGGTQSAWSASAFLGSSAIDYPNLDYSDPKNSAKWLWVGTF